MNLIILIIAIVAISMILCSKQESYYNVFGQWVDGPFDQKTDGIDMSSPAYRLSKTPYYWWWHHGIPYVPGYNRYWRWWR